MSARTVSSVISGSIVQLQNTRSSIFQVGLGLMLVSFPDPDSPRVDRLLGGGGGGGGMKGGCGHVHLSEVTLVSCMPRTHPSRERGSGDFAQKPRSSLT